MKVPSVVYHIFPDRFYNEGSNELQYLQSWSTLPKHNSFFGGNLRGIINKLDYLQSMGIQTIYLNPIFKSPSNHRYNITNYFEIDPLLGDFSTFRKLLECVHSKGMGLILDGVFNHCSVDFFAFKDVLKNNEKSKFKDWFIIKKFPVKVGTGFYQSWKGHYQLVEFNYNNPEVRDYIIKVAKFWTFQGIDGWRLDAPERIDVAFWSRFYKETKNINKDLLIIGEIWENPYKYFKVFDGVTNYLFRETVLNFFKSLSLYDLIIPFENYYKRIPFENLISSWNVLSSHDTKRIYTILKGSTKKLTLAIDLQFIFPGSPIIYYGDEIGMEGDEDPDCRTTFEWRKRFWNTDILNHYKNRIELWKKSDVLKYGKYEGIYLSKDLAFLERSYLYEKVLIGISLRDSVDVDI